MNVCLSTCRYLSYRNIFKIAAHSTIRPMSSNTPAENTLPNDGPVKPKTEKQCKLY